MCLVRFDRCCTPNLTSLSWPEFRKLFPIVEVAVVGVVMLVVVLTGLVLLLLLLRVRMVSPRMPLLTLRVLVLAVVRVGLVAWVGVGACGWAWAGGWAGAWACACSGVRGQSNTRACVSEVPSALDLPPSPLPRKSLEPPAAVCCRSCGYVLGVGRSPPTGI